MHYASPILQQGIIDELRAENAALREELARARERITALQFKRNTKEGEDYWYHAAIKAEQELEQAKKYNAELIEHNKSIWNKYTEYHAELAQLSADTTSDNAAIRELCRPVLGDIVDGVPELDPPHIVDVVKLAIERQAQALVILSRWFQHSVGCTRCQRCFGGAMDVQSLDCCDRVRAAALAEAGKERP